MAKKILIAEDEKQIVEFLSLRLEESGYEFICAYTGPEALEKARSEKPNLILLDYTLPKMKGTEVCRQIKSDPSLCHIRVILLSAYREDQISGRDLADAYIGKPYDPDELLNKIKELLA
ncbi:MAG: response regulator [Candidatus Omnitrophica bacterium]|nr:response regulator [Candidatus Omnitrophota bacterium]